LSAFAKLRKPHFWSIPYYLLIQRVSCSINWQLKKNH